MEIDCKRCGGSGEVPCCECGQMKDCGECDGTGCFEGCISDFNIPTHWRDHDELKLLQADAVKCISDHAKLIQLNPRAKESYDNQLATTLQKLNEQAEELEP